jgi:hypothetical protein
MTKTDKELTQGVLDSTLENLSILNELQELYLDSETRHAGDLDKLRELVNVRPRATQLDQLIDDLYSGSDTDQDPVTLWLNDTLEIRQLGYRSIGDSWIATGTQVTISWGGPNVYLTIKDSPNLALVEVYWGGDSNQGSVLIPQIVSTVNELLDAYDLV